MEQAIVARPRAGWNSAEEELLNIRPKRDAIVSTNERCVLGEEQRMELTLRHIRPFQLSREGLPQQLDSVLSVRCDGMSLEQAKKEDRHVVRSR